MSTVYRSGSPDKAKLLDNDLHNTIKKMSLSKEYSQIVISGDFNHPSIKWTETLGEDGDNLVIPELSRQHNPDHHDVAFLECLNDSLLLQHVTKPTRYRDDQQPTLDDLILTSDDHTINNLKYKPHLSNSDHIMLSFDVCFQFDKPKQVPKTRYNYQKTDVAKMNDMLNKDWSSELEGKSPEEAYNSFLETYTLAVEECVPKSITMVDNKYIKPIWMKADTLRLIKKKHNSHTRYLNTKQKADKAAYKVIRNKVTHQVEQDRADFERKVANEVKENTKAFWRYVNSSKKTRSSIPDLKCHDGNLQALPTRKPMP